ncbi:tetratricopeptide repeat protein [Actinomadura syzygii]|uniref:Tetratricopeptide repeat protein n=1 Tax=Actinomadura syzygii TaxID=1427538 RepID=A0A5D0UI44_9ACTN|nr:tetratricopeptide repeat protein [Actinomadura syzygii]TYC17714.1 tetratricopeptide repeat protein [Actinomadura syzygii]
MCAGLDIKGWSKRLVPEQIRAQQALVSVALTACREAGLPEEIVQSSGDGVLIMPPSDIDESKVIPALVSELEVALHQENRLLADAAKIRLRLALTSGLVTPGPAGFNGTAVIECFRLLDGPPVKAALDDHPRAELAVVVSDHLFQDVIRNGFGSLRAEEFWRVRSELPDKGFSMDAWLYVSDRADGPRTPPSGSTVAPSGAPGGVEPDGVSGVVPGAGPGTTPAYDGVADGAAEGVAEAWALLARGRTEETLDLLRDASPADRAARAAVLDVRAEALMRLGDHERARRDLEELLGLRGDPSEPPAPSALLRLGRCHVALGAVQEARQTWTFLLEHRPTAVEAYLELGRLERRARRHATAQSYLVEGVRLLRGGRDGAVDPAAADRLLDGLLYELAALPVADDADDPGDGAAARPPAAEPDNSHNEF